MRCECKKELLRYPIRVDPPPPLTLERRPTPDGLLGQSCSPACGTLGFSSTQPFAMFVFVFR